MTTLDTARDVHARLEAAWNDGDGWAFAALYAADASFVTIRGEHLAGRTAIGAGHAAILGSIYAGSVNRMEVLRAEQITDDVVVSVSCHTLDCPVGPLAGVRRATSTSVLRREADAWRVVATHNTLGEA